MSLEFDTLEAKFWLIFQIHSVKQVIATFYILGTSFVKLA